MNSGKKARRKILVVDDDEGVREAYDTLFSLEFPNLEIVSVESVVQATEFCATGNAKLTDLVILDGLGGGMIEVVDALLTHGFRGKIIVISGGGLGRSIPANFFDSVSAVLKKGDVSLNALAYMAHSLLT